MCVFSHTCVPDIGAPHGSIPQLSIVDHVPRELMALSLLNLRVEYEAGHSPEGPSTALRVRVQDIRVDDMMYATRCPVVVAAYDGQQAGVRNDVPLLRGVLVSQHVRGRRRLHYPFVSSQFSSTLQVRSQELLDHALCGKVNTKNRHKSDTNNVIS